MISDTVLLTKGKNLAERTAMLSPIRKKFLSANLTKSFREELFVVEVWGVSVVSPPDGKVEMENVWISPRTMLAVGGSGRDWPTERKGLMYGPDAIVNALRCMEIARNTKARRLIWILVDDKSIIVMLWRVCMWIVFRSDENAQTEGKNGGMWIFGICAF